MNITEEYQSKFAHFLSNELTPLQRESAIHKEGVILVRACAGAGKTRVITARVTNFLLNEQIPASSILALTFTNKAAHEMKTRIMQSLPPEWPRPIIGTFHSFCLQFLKQYRKQPFTLMDTHDREQCIKDILKKSNVHKKITPQNISSAISRYKNDIQSLAQLSQPLPGDSQYQQLYLAYEQEKKAAHCLDFDDLLLETLKLFQSDDTIRAHFQQRIKHILVDEYQDTNRIQHALIHTMSFSVEQQFMLTSLCVVGDEDQSIYAWRGATISNILKFPTQFPQVKTITLEQNYRSVQPILQMADDIIKQNSQRVPKTIWSDRPAQNRIRVISCSSAFQEGDIIIGAAHAFKRNASLSKLAILYRSHAQSRMLEEALIRHSIPYKIIGGTQFYDRQEIKDLLAYIRLTVNPFDRISLKRCINTPARSLGESFVEMFINLWDQTPASSCIEVAQHIINNKLVTPSKAHALNTFLQIVKPLDHEESVSAYLERVTTLTQFFTYLTNAYDPKEAQERIANVHELLNAARARELQGITSPAQFLEEVTLLQDQIEDKSDAVDYVRLMTLHSAKGLEFDTVIIPGVEEGLLPSAHAWSAESVEEERRLLYVGVTRARERLIVSYSATRYLFGRVTNQGASRFLDTIPAEIAPVFDIATWSSTRIITDIEHWITNKPTLSSYQQAYPQPQKPAFTKHSSPAAMRENNLACPWKINQKVSHPQFGIGTIICVESVGVTTPKLTIQFKEGLKKISASFVESSER